MRGAIVLAISLSLLPAIIEAIADGSPYQGAVVDGSGRPIPDALVVLMWHRHDPQVPGLLHLASAQESLTNAAGEFSIGVSTPKSGDGPRLIIFKPGFSSFPEEVDTPPGTLAAEFLRPGKTVILRQLVTYNERVSALNAVVAMLSRADAWPSSALVLTHDILRSALDTLARDNAAGAPDSSEARPSGCRSIAPYAGGGWDSYLQGYHGPYRGRVIDAVTKAPVVGAVIVAEWSYDRTVPLHSISEIYAVRETTTDMDGEFVLKADDVECRAPRQTSRPYFVVFRPGYGAFPFNQAVPRGFTGGVFEGAGTTVELPPMTDSTRRREQLAKLTGPFLSQEATLPHFMRLIDVERRALGLQSR